MEILLFSVVLTIMMKNKSLKKKSIMLPDRKSDVSFGKRCGGVGAREVWMQRNENNRKTDQRQNRCVFFLCRRSDAIAMSNALGRMFAGTVLCRVFNRFPPGGFGAAAPRESRWKAKTAAVHRFARAAAVAGARARSPDLARTRQIPSRAGPRPRTNHLSALPVFRPHPVVRPVTWNYSGIGDRVSAPDGNNVRGVPVTGARLRDVAGRGWRSVVLYSRCPRGFWKGDSVIHRRSTSSSFITPFARF